MACFITFNPVSQFLFWCAFGVNPGETEIAQQNRVKYLLIGLSVLVIGISAAFSFGFLFELLFSFGGIEPNVSEPIAVRFLKVLFSVFSGVGIIFFYRWLLSFIKKGDGSSRITFKEIHRAVPLIISAVMLCMIIVTPILLKVYETEINIELRIKQQEKLAELNGLTGKRFQYDIDRIDADLLKIETDRNVLVERQKAAEQEYVDQMQGRSGMAGYGPKAKQLESLKDEKTKHVVEFDERTKTQVESLRNQRQKKIEELDYELNVTNLEQAHNLESFMTRLKIMNTFENVSSFLFFNIMIFFLIGPMYLKMMIANSQSGDYQ